MKDISELQRNIGTYSKAREKIIELLTARNNVERILGATEKEKNHDRQQGHGDDFSRPTGNSKHRRRLKNPDAAAPGFTGSWGINHPQASAGIYRRIACRYCTEFGTNCFIPKLVKQPTAGGGMTLTVYP